MCCNALIISTISTSTTTGSRCSTSRTQSSTRPGGRASIRRLSALGEPRGPVPQLWRRTGRFRRRSSPNWPPMTLTAGPWSNGNAASSTPRTARAKARSSSRDHIIRVTERAFDDFAGGGSGRGRQPPDAGAADRTDGERHGEQAHGPIRLGMVGGGNDAFIGGVHRIAARIDGEFELVAGALSSTPEKARASGQRAWGWTRRAPMTTSRRWRSREARLKDGIEAVVDRHPQPHALPGRARIPETRHPCDLRQAADRRPWPRRSKLVQAAEGSGALFVLTHNYTGYPMVRQARQMVAEGRIGDDPRGAGRIRAGLADRGPAGNKQADWRTDPARSGAGGSTGDIGTHAFNLAQLRHRAGTRTALRRSAGLRAGAAARRQRPCDAALHGRRARHAVVQPGGARQRKRAAAACLRRQGRAGMGAGKPQPALVHALRRAKAADHPRRGREPLPTPPASRGCRRAIPRAIWKVSPISMPRPPARSAPGAMVRPFLRMWCFPAWQRVWRGCSSSTPAQGHPPATGHG